MTVWISHRGIKERFTENTIGAFDDAYRAGFRFLETDLRLSSDGVLFLAHDDHLDRVGGAGVRISTTPASTIRKARLLCGSGLAEFEEFATRFHDCRWILDIKPETAEGVIRSLAEWAQSHGEAEALTARVRFLIWKTEDRDLLKQFFPRADVFPMERECYVAALSILISCGVWALVEKQKTYALTPRFKGMRLFTERMVRAYHSRGARVLAYLPSELVDLKMAVSLRFDEILTDGRIVDGV